jgi:hypothetical protein
MDYRNEIAKLIDIGLDTEVIQAALSVPDGDNGDFCLPCFKFFTSMVSAIP